MARIAQPGARLVLLVARERHALLVEVAQSPHPASALADGRRPRGLWLRAARATGPRGRVRGSRRVALTARPVTQFTARERLALLVEVALPRRSQRPRCRPLARAHCEVLGRALQREPKQSRSTSEFSIAAGQASNIAD